jgi:hypothetical protein
MKSSVLTGVAFAAIVTFSVVSASAAFAEDAMSHDCKAALDTLSKDYEAAGLATPSKPSGGMVQGKMGHHHSGAEITVARNHFNEAKHMCEKGMDHESMLHMDVVRALINLPAVEHPADHHYAKPAKE